MNQFNTAMINDSHYVKMHETEKFVVGYIYECAYITDKTTGKTSLIGDFYGNPTCGLISDDNQWCLVGGSTLMLWTKSEVCEIKDDNLFWAYKFRQTDDNKVEILIDPWAHNASVWELNIETRESRKLRDFDMYKDKEYTSDIE